jgi:hypothetical protein
MNVTHNTSTCKSESIKIIRFIDIFNINKVPSLFRYNHPTTSGTVNVFFYTSPSPDLWFLHYFAKSHKFQKSNYKGNEIHFSQFQTRGAFICLRALYFTKESINSFNSLFIIFNARTLLELLSSGLTLCSSIRINENNNSQKFTNARLIGTKKNRNYYKEGTMKNI